MVSWGLNLNDAHTEIALISNSRVKVYTWFILTEVLA